MKVKQEMKYMDGVLKFLAEMDALQGPLDVRILVTALQR